MTRTVHYAAAKDYSGPEVRRALAEILPPVLAACGGVKGKRILLKPNLLFCRRPDDPATVHPAVITAVAAALREAGAGEIVLLENPGTQTVRAIIDRMGIAETLSASGVFFDDFADYRERPLPDACVFRSLKIAREFEKFDLVADLAKAKTHAMMTLTLAVKNLFGLVDSAGRIGWHLAVGSDFERFADLLLDLYLTVRPRICIIDGIIGMEGNGPGSGTPVERNFLAASDDALALDASVAEKLGVPAGKFLLLRRAARRGLEFAFEDSGAVPPVRPFRLPDPPGILNAWGVILPPFFKTQLRNLVGSRPVLRKELCIGCGRCAEVCPPRSLKMGREKRPLFDLNHCIRCYCCQEHCPKGAIVTRPQLLTAFLSRMIKLVRR